MQVPSVTRRKNKSVGRSVATSGRKHQPQKVMFINNGYNDEGSTNQEGPAPKKRILRQGQQNLKASIDKNICNAKKH